MVKIDKETGNNVFSFIACCAVVYGFLYISITFLEIVAIFLSMNTS